MIIVTHEMGFAYHACDKVAFLGQHRTIVSADLVGSFATTVQFGNFEIYPVFLQFPNFHLEQNYSPSSLAKLCDVALENTKLLELENRATMFDLSPKN